MDGLRYRTPRKFLQTLLPALSMMPLLIPALFVPGISASRPPAKNNQPRPSAVRWDEQNPGCTFSHTDDGHFHYGLWYEDVGITVTIDSQELEKVHRRHEPFFGALLDIRYRGKGSLDLDVAAISLEFVKHFKVVQTALDPDNFTAKVQNDADALDHETAREVERHPEKKEAKEAYVRAFLKDSAELQEFVGKNSLRPTSLGPGNPEVGGWVLFSTSSKWISGWKKQEEFILRLPLAGKVFEFPFKLPPQPGEVLLRKRE
ncbi:MAG TPA: hypothetical protein VGM18_07135 [Candidatus Sulfotelmatobacter sp.]|jgi:hypothetical protein